MNKSLVLLVALAGASSSYAQVPVFTQSSATYVPLTGATNIVFSSLDDSGTIVPLGFSFPFFGQNYTEVQVTTNGMVTFDTTPAPGVCSYGCLSSYPIPSTSSAYTVIAPFWDDLHVGTGAVRYTSTPGEFVVEWSNVRSYGGTITSMSMQLKLAPSGSITFHYGPITGTGGSAAVGFQNRGGTLGASTMATGTSVCSSTSQAGCCSSGTANCTVTEWVPNTVVTIGEPLQADLAPTSVTIANLTVLGNNNITFDLSGTVRNFGRTAAPNFMWNAYLSTDRTLNLDGGTPDILVASGGPVSLPAVVDGGVVVTGINSPAATTTPPPTGNYYVLLQVDSTDVVTEASETNNVGSTANYFTQGLDLVATSITGVANTGGGNVDSINVNYFNQGTQAAGTVAFRIYLSTDRTLDATDYVLYNGTRTVSGGETVNEAVPVTMPANAPSGDYYYILQIDPLNALTEASETNNVAASVAKVTISRADLVNEAVEFVDTVTGLPIRTAKFGEAARATVRVSNQGGANATNFKLGVVVSNDANLSLLSDTLVYEQTVTSLVAHAPAQTFTLDFNLPLKDQLNVDFPTGPYFVFVVVDSTGAIYESNKQNNNQSIGPIRISAPGPDLVVSSVQAPATAGVGEIVPIVRGFRNLGNVDAPAAEYRYYASANTIVTSQDVPLELVTATGTVPSGSVTLARGAGSTATDLVKLPGTMPPGQYYIGCLIDPLNQIAELDKTNNSLASSAVQISPSSLQVVTSQLPDAIVGRPYLFRLVASGEQGPSTWAIDAAQGQLPAGLTLGTDGLLSGTLTADPITTAFTVTVANGTRTAAARLVIRVLPATTEIQITTTGIPALVNSPSTQFQYSLGAAGGTKPYTWRVASTTGLPAGLTLGGDGLIAGSPRAGTPNGITRVTFEVRDAFGGTARADLPIRLIAAGAIAFRTTTLPNALMGGDYAEDVAVQNLDGSALAKPLVFRLSGTLPDGITMQPETEVVSLTGRAARAGSFRFTLSVEDALGRTDSMDYTISVYPPRYKLNVSNLPTVLHPGETGTNVTFTVSPAQPVRYAVTAGALPPGLTLSTDGVISGTVDSADTSVGTWTFVIEATDSAGSSGMAPYALYVEPAPPKQGCSSSGSLTPLVALALGFFLLRRRPVRQPALAKAGRLALPFALALALGLPTAASAQTYQVEGPRPITYANLATGTALSPTTSTGANITLPFALNYFGQPITTLAVSRYGYLAVGGSDAAESYNEPIPHNISYYPAAFIAPWWDTLSGTGGTFKWTVTGTAPFRVVIVEWRDVTYSSSTSVRFSMQVMLYEGTGQIRFAYGPTAPGAGSSSVGLQKQLGQGVAGMTCGTSGTCGVSNWPANQALDFFLPPDLRIASLAIDQAGYAGVSYRAAALVRNEGGKAASNVIVRFYLSTDATLDASDVLIGDGTAANVDAQSELLVVSTAPIPAASATGNYFVIAKVDPDNTIAEQVETNNVSPPMSMVIGAPKADLVSSDLTAPATAAPGASLQVTRTLRNAGNAASPAFKYTYFLSDNSVVSIADTALSPVGQNAGLAAAAVDTNQETVTLPAALAAGMYWLGVCVNYDAAASGVFPVDEISVVNNCFTATAPILVTTGQLDILTTSLPAATQYAPYGLRLAASGGNGQYTWSIDSGALPTGLTLSPAGDLQGAPAVATTASFTVKVVSGSLEKTQALSLQITTGNIPLVIVDQELPAAEFGRAYFANLVGVGGKPPYQWALSSSSELPPGIALATDGHLEGRAGMSGEQKFTVVLTDAANATSSRELKLRVVNPTTLSVATLALPSGVVKREYLQELKAVGGRAPYSWAVTRFQALPENPTSQPGPVLQTLPDNFGLVVEDGVQQDFLRGVPKLAGRYSLTLKVTDAAGSEDLATLVLFVSYIDGLAITTTLLPDGFISQNYAVKLSHNGGRDAEGIQFSLPCVQQAVRVDEFACVGMDPNQTLPPGLQLGADGSIIGAPVGPEGTYTFLVKVVDLYGREDTRGMSIRIKPDYTKEQKTGCSGLPMAPSALSLLSLLGLALRRRRS